MADLRVQRTNKLLFDAFEEMILETPYSEITVSALCERAMVRRNTFYDHFPDKQGFLNAYIACVRGRFAGDIPKEGDSSFAEFAEKMTRQLASRIIELKPVLSRLKINGTLGSLYPAVAQTIAHEMRPRVADCLAASTSQAPDADSFCTFYSYGLVGLICAWINSDDELNVDAFMDSYRSVAAPMLEILPSA